jgi:hypothetical protein
LSVAQLRAACQAVDPEPIADLALELGGERVVERWRVIARGRVR